MSCSCNNKNAGGIVVGYNPVVEREAGERRVVRQLAGALGRSTAVDPLLAAEIAARAGDPMRPNGLAAHQPRPGSAENVVDNLQKAGFLGDDVAEAARQLARSTGR